MFMKCLVVDNDSLMVFLVLSDKYENLMHGFY
jgi:hypothetical protein